MSDRDQSIRDPEADRPFREAFARRLPPETRRELEERAREAYHAALEEHGSPHGLPDASDMLGRLRAVVVDLRETSALLGAVWCERQESELNSRDTILSLLAGPRALEVQAVAERVEALVLFEPTLARPLPPELVEAELVPSTYLDTPLDRGA